jgi:hypothetical protein
MLFILDLIGIIMDILLDRDHYLIFDNHILCLIVDIMDMDPSK